MKGKRIILTVTNDLTYDRRMHRICHSLAEAGSEVILVGRRHKDSKTFSPTGFKGVRLKCIFNKGPLFYIEFNKRLFLYLMTSRFDVSCACDLDTALAVHWASGLKNRKSVYDAHELFTEVPELQGRSFVKRIWGMIGRMTIPHFDLRYTVGDELAALMGKLYNVPFHMIRNIEPHSMSRNNSIPVDDRNRVLLYQGALNKGRGLEACILAMSNLPHWEFWLAGEGDISGQLKELAKQLHVEQKVKFLGWVMPDQLPPLMDQARLGINLLEKNSLSYYYSLPNKFFDCIHAGLPAINMNFPEYARVNDQYPCSILMDELSAEKIVHTIQMLDDHPEMLVEMSKACKDAANVFTWEKESEKLVGLYQDLMGN